MQAQCPCRRFAVAAIASGDALVTGLVLLSNTFKEEIFE
jgi:hypothetical protein